MTPVRIGIIGAGAVSDFHHVPGIKLDPRCQLTVVCDPNQELLAKRLSEWGEFESNTDAVLAATSPNVDAVIIATPNYTHCPIALAAIDAGKHVMCEKPLGVSYAEANTMREAAERKGVVHMTAFTYRFAPSMRYIADLVEQKKLGQPRHFRSQRFLDLPETSWGWRQSKKLAGAGDLYDMTIHRIDFAQMLLGPIARVCGAAVKFVDRSRTAAGEPCPASEVDDWSSLIGEFTSGAVGVWEGSTLMKGYHNQGLGYEWAEINASCGSVVYQLAKPNTVLISWNDEPLHEEPVPTHFLKPIQSPRSTTEGNPSTLFRYDLVYEFVSAIIEQREAVPSFRDGALAQAVADAVLISQRDRTWVEVADVAAGVKSVTT